MSSPDDLSYSLFLENLSLSDVPEKSLVEKVRPRKAISWVKDDSVTRCKNCEIEFGWFVRKHHCRACGKIFCHNCSSKMIVLPRDVENFPKSTNREWISYMLGMFKKEKKKIPERVCDECEKTYCAMYEVMSYVQILDQLKLDLKDLQKLARVSRDWNRATNIFKSIFRDIQYHLPTSKMTDREEDLIKLNSKFFSGHSRWLCQLIKTTDWDDENSSKMTMKMLKKKRKINCWSLMCTRFCKEKLGYEEALELLYYRIPNVNFREYLISCFSCLEEKVLLCLVPFLCFDVVNDSFSKSHMTQFLIELSKKNALLRNNIYWNLVALKNRNSDYDYFYRKYLSELNQLCGKSVVWGQLVKTRQFIKKISRMPKFENCDDAKTYLAQKLQPKLMFDFDIEMEQIDVDFQVPFFPNLWAEKLIIEKIDIRPSATSPLIMPFLCRDEFEKLIEKKIMYKPENLSKDTIIINIIRTMDFILKREENLDLNILTYNVLPISAKNGLIEIIAESETIHSIKYKKNFTIQNYILECNPSLTVREVRDRIVKSSAAYCLIPYLLGVGDRHLDNIMISKEGYLFHVDYGFVMGFDPKPIVPYMRIPGDLVDAMGGVNSKDYAKFKEYCSRAYLCLRGYTNLFTSMLMLLTEDPETNLSISKLENEISDRFAPAESNSDADKKLFNRMDISQSSIAETFFIDFLHYHSKETTHISKSFSEYLNFFG